MFKSRTCYTVAQTAYIDQVFTEIPSNAFIDKGRCGIGATTLELNTSRRCSIIVVPTIGILIDKKTSHPNLFLVYGKVSTDDVRNQLALRLPGQKIMTTPEGMKKIMEAGANLNMLDILKDYWFLMLDECHTFATEDYRKDILRPFDYFDCFSQKAMLTATPYYFTDERFSTLDHYQIKFEEKLGKVKLVDCKSVAGALNYIVTSNMNGKRNLHIFLNSVTEIKLTIERANLKECNIFCAPDKENMQKLGDLQKHFTEQPDTSNFQKVNFYTSRYFEGWDMFDEDAIIILVTDVQKPHTQVSIGMKLKQAVGRLRNEPIQIIHITNHHHITTQPKTIKEFEVESYTEAKFRLNQYNEYLTHCKLHDIKPKECPYLEKYADFAYKTKVATLNKMMLDQQINQAYSNEMYNHINLIRQEWENGYYEVEMLTSNHLVQTSTTMKRKSKATILKEDYLEILEFNRKQVDHIQYVLGCSPIEKFKSSNPLAVQASNLLDEATMERLGYNVKRVEAEVILVSNSTKEAKLLKLLDQEFKRGGQYSNEDVINKLQRLYNRLEIKDKKTGNTAKAQASHLTKNKWFETEACKLKDDKGKYTVHGLTILRPSFSVMVAA